MESRHEAGHDEGLRLTQTQYLPLVGRSGGAEGDAGVGGRCLTPPGALKRARHPPHQGEG